MADLELSRDLTRRRMLGATLLAAVGAAAAACAPAPPPAPTTVPKPAAAAPTAAPSAAPTTVPAAAAAPKSAGPVELQVMNVEAYSAELDKKVFPVGYDMFSKENGGRITVKETILPENAQYYVKILTTIAGGTPPDACYVHPAQGLPQFAGQGVIIPLEPYIQSDQTIKFDDFYKGPLSYYQYPLGDKQYGLPYYSGPSITVFNKKIFQKYGEKTPDEYEKSGQWTWEKLIEVGLKLTKGSGADKTFGYTSVTSALHWLNIVVWGHGSDLWDDKMERTLLGEAIPSDALDMYASLQYKHQIVPSAAESDGLPGGFLAGRTGVMYAIKGNIPSVRDAVDQGKLDVGMVGIPKGPKGRFVRNGPNSYGILKTSAHQDEDWKLVNFMTQSGFQTLQNVIGASVPIRKSILTSGEFAKSLQPWESLDVYKEASDIDKPLRFAPTHPDIQAAFGAEYDLVKLGKQSYKEGAAKFVPKIDGFLKKAKEG